MSKAKYGNSNLYMTTREFADLIIDALHEQNYFGRDETAHPGDIAFAFSTLAETIGSTMSWAIRQEHEPDKKNAVMQTGNLSKWSSHSGAIKEYGNIKEKDADPISEEESGYSEYRHKNAYL
jgi:hypothetical protein